MRNDNSTSGPVGYSQSAVARFGFVLSVLAFLGLIFLFYWKVDRSLFTDWTVYAAILGCSMLYLGSTSISALVWIIIVRKSSSAAVLPLPLFRIYCLIQMGKYIPGNFAHLMGRVVLARKHGLSTALTLFTMFIEIAWAVSVAALLGLLSLSAIGSELLSGVEKVPNAWLLAMAFLVTMLMPFVAHRFFAGLMAWWARRQGREFQSLHLPQTTTLALSASLLFLNFLVLGAIMYILVTVVFMVDEADILVLTGVFSIAWIAGFLTPGSPAGLGVREVIMMSALAPLYGGEIAIGVSALYRVVSVAGDGLAFVVGMLMNRGKRFQYSGSGS